jgi:Adenylylsulphate kinase
VPQLLAAHGEQDRGLQRDKAEAGKDDLVAGELHGRIYAEILAHGCTVRGQMTMTQAEALALLKTGASIFLTGQPGSGKTHTVNRYVRELQRQGIDYAYTWSGIGVRETLGRRDLSHERRRSTHGIER